ncbi:MAG: YabP/YqfC family sporulation protein [Ruminococcus sp.]|nr:YabP/YqfC family sporulation protein [Ruminococcus sp.]MBQ3947637.1 YabP/YqfC family sporulation protein [Ruminococcus sp.]MBR6394613.1 YabP/YqfC family sporulation protein [Ruminococcus sp.]MCR5730596.1 YabP/YqfC family sporulation protein [Ruminococcus sp.]
MFDKIADRARESFFLEPQIYFDCDRQLLIENCRRIEEYNEIFMKLISGKLCIQIWGSDLKAYDFRGNGLIVRGKIAKVEFIERGDSKNEGANAEKNKDKC